MNKILFAALSCAVSAAAFAAPEADTGAELRRAQTEARLAAEHTKMLQDTYSDIYFVLDSLTVESFEAKVAAGDTFFAYIGRPSCGDCNAFEPMFKRYIAKHKLGSRIYFVNVHRLHADKAAWTAFRQKYGLSGTPVLAKYSGGRQENKLDFEDNGGIKAADLEQWLKQNGLF